MFPIRFFIALGLAKCVRANSLAPLAARRSSFYARLPLAFFFIQLGLIRHAAAAACCGGGFAAPAMIVGDDKAQVTGSFTHTKVISDVDSLGIWYPREQSEQSETFRLEAAHIAWDRFQFGASIPVVQRSGKGHQSTGFGDISETAGFEALPEWDYNVWRPRGFVYLQLTNPSGRDVNESRAAFQLDARGRGFWSTAIGAILTKTYRDFDFFVNLDLHRSYDHHFATSQASGELHPGWGGNFSLGAGYNLQNWRFGSELTWTYEDPVRATGDLPSSGALQRFATASFAVTYLFKGELSTNVIYSDQTWFGEPNNTTLGRSVSLNLQKRWPR